MCAMMACIAPNELGLDVIRVRMFVEAYIGELRFCQVETFLKPRLDILTRLRLFNVAAYIRKYSAVKFHIGHVNLERKCQNCGKLVESPSLIRRNGGNRFHSGYSYCNFCRRAATSCAIWYVIHVLLGNVSDFFQVIYQFAKHFLCVSCARMVVIKSVIANIKIGRAHV